MGDVVSLGKARKARAGTEKAARTRENRVRHGRGKARKTADRARRSREEARLDGKRIDHDDS